MLGRKNAQIPTKSCGSIKLTFTPTMRRMYARDESMDEDDGGRYINKGGRPQYPFGLPR